MSSHIDVLIPTWKITKNSNETCLTCVLLLATAIFKDPASDYSLPTPFKLRAETATLTSVKLSKEVIYCKMLKLISGFSPA